MSYFAGYIPNTLEILAGHQAYRARDGADVWNDYGEVLQAQEEKAARLKALRLAKAADAAAAVLLKPKRMRKLTHA
jgi:hypothetical protein